MGKRIMIPRIKNFETAIRLYYENMELGTAEIQELFLPKKGESLSISKVTQLKNAVKEVQRQRGVLTYSSSTVNTELAYEVWGLNIVQIERRYKHLCRLKKDMEVSS
ncbi:MAG: hypothetical protein ACI4DY_07700 [Monoglobaceae bacterium]